MSNDKNVVQPESMNFRAWDEDGKEIPSDQFPRIYDPDDLNGFYSPRSDLYTPPQPEKETATEPTEDAEYPRLCVCKDDLEQRDEKLGLWGAVGLVGCIVIWVIVFGAAMAVIDNLRLIPFHQPERAQPRQPD